MVRLKQRYIVIEINKTDEIQDSFRFLSVRDGGIYLALVRSVQDLYGDFGVAAVSYTKTKYCNEYTRIAVLKARRGTHKLVTSALPLIKKIDNINVSVLTLYVGATIKHCFNFVKNYQQKKLEQYCYKHSLPENDKVQLQKSFMELKELRGLLGMLIPRAK